MARKEKTGSWILSYVTGMDVLDEQSPPSAVHHVGVFDSAEAAITGLEEYIKANQAGYFIPSVKAQICCDDARKFLSQHDWWSGDLDSNTRFYIEQAEI